MNVNLGSALGAYNFYRFFADTLPIEPAILVSFDYCDWFLLEISFKTVSTYFFDNGYAL